MKIKSPFQDYYDYSCTYFDNSTFYGRIPLAIQNETLLEDIKKSLPSSYNRSDDILQYYPGFVILAGIVYPFVKIFKRKKSGSILKGLFELEGIYYEDSDKIPRQMKKVFEWKGKEFDVSCPVAVYDSGNVELPKGVVPENFEGNVYDYAYDFHKKFVLNAQLKTYKFPMDGRIVLQTIETYLNRHKEIQTTKITNDIALRDSKGFDKHSFKTRK